MKINNWKNNIKDETIDQYDYVGLNNNEDKIIKKYSEIIGSFLIQFNNLEHELNLAISYYFIDDMVHEGYLISKNLMFRNKIELFNDLYLTKLSFSEKKDLGLKKLKHLYNDLISINTFRNYVIHANWLTLDKENYVRTKLVTDNEGGIVKGKKVKITPSVIRININKINTIINQICYIKEYPFS